MNRRSSTLQTVGFTLVLLSAVGLLLTGLGVFGVPSVNDFRDWDSYYEKRDTLWAEQAKLSLEFNKLHRELEPLISGYFDDPNSFVETTERRAAKEVLLAKLKAHHSKSKALQKKSDKLRKKADKLDRQYPPELVSKYAPHPSYDRW